MFVPDFRNGLATGICAWQPHHTRLVNQYGLVLLRLFVCSGVLVLVDRAYDLAPHPDDRDIERMQALETTSLLHLLMGVRTLLGPYHSAMLGVALQGKGVYVCAVCESMCGVDPFAATCASSNNNGEYGAVSHYATGAASIAGCTWGFRQIVVRCHRKQCYQTCALALASRLHCDSCCWAVLASRYGNAVEAGRTLVIAGGDHGVPALAPHVAL